MDALGLLMYGILLFPQLEDYVDLVAMGVFLAKKNKGENPAMAVLADTYYSLHQCDERRRGILRCCTPLLYLWLTSHLFQCKHRTTCPIEDFKWSWILPMTKEEWVRKLEEASEKSIRWYPPWNEREQIIIKCEGYPNVPLLGTEGAINYNPELTVQQAGYPIITLPTEEALTPFVLPGPEALKGVHYQKIRRAWSSPTKNGVIEKLRSCGASPEYRQWVEERVRTPRDSSPQQYEVPETLEVKRLKVSLDKTKAERAHWKRKLEEALDEIYHEKHVNDEITKKARVERETRLRIGSCLKAADKEMCTRRAKRDQVTIQKERLKEALLDSQRREDEQRE
ncbi:hypothetical protein CR513_01043, partial [Mucuna pruriens]